MQRHEVLKAMNVNNPAGPSLMEISDEELKRVYGSGDVQAETTYPCFTVAYYGYNAAVWSSQSCAYAVGGAVGVGLSIWKC